MPEGNQLVYTNTSTEISYKMLFKFSYKLNQDANIDVTNGHKHSRAQRQLFFWKFTDKLPKKELQTNRRANDSHLVINNCEVYKGEKCLKAVGFDNIDNVIL